MPSRTVTYREYHVRCGCGFNTIGILDQNYGGGHGWQRRKDAQKAARRHDKECSLAHHAQEETA